MDARLPAHLEVAAIRRLAEAEGGFATVLASGERDAGTIALVIVTRAGEGARLFERRPQIDGNRNFVETRREDIENKGDFLLILERMRQRDPDLWLIEADVPDSERFIAGLPR